MKEWTKIKTLGELKKAGYKSRSVRQELRENLIEKIKANETIFEGILGFEDTVIPDIKRAILSQHSVLLLGLRGQAKTRIARLLAQLLDDYIPVIKGSEINDDPLAPISFEGITTVKEQGDATEIEWLHKTERYVEKLATPDVSVADLIGDVDPIKASIEKLNYSDERVIHFGLIPRAHRSIFVINELPDLQARIQVSLFNILQEGDIQIRGFKLRLPLDISFVFTANPEDYTNRGTIITPLKDRIESQILTHYPYSPDISKQITKQEARLSPEQMAMIEVPDVARNLLEYVTIEAREHEFVDDKSGVSMRMSITALENLVSAAEYRIILNAESRGRVRLSDFWGVIPAITGKVELLYEGEQMGHYELALDFLGKAVEKLFLMHFPHPNAHENTDERDPFGEMRAYFSAGNQCLIPMEASEQEYRESLQEIAGLQKLIKKFDFPKATSYFMMELVLHALAEFDILSKDVVGNSLFFKDDLADMLGDVDL